MNKSEEHSESGKKGLRRRITRWQVAGFILLLVVQPACVPRESAANPLTISTSTGSLDNPRILVTPTHQKNPYEGIRRQARQGELLYQANCASCHGETGEGDGPVASSLEPLPGNLASRIEDLGDLYLYWRIADGGLIEPFNSLMPAWRGILNEDQIWQVITYLRTFADR
jgi:hypothetical protein